MAYFRKKPVVIEAVQFTSLNANEVCAFIGVDKAAAYDLNRETLHIDIPTLEGVMRADEGDWIIKGVAGEFYPCKSSIFEATYEEVPCP